MRNVLVWLGMADPWETSKLVEDQDPVTQQLGALVTACYDVFGSKPFKVKDAIREATREPKPGESAAEIEARARLYEAMEEVSRHRGKPSPWVIGMFIRKHKERYRNGLRFERAGDAQNTACWWVKPLSEGQSDELDKVIPKAPAKKPGKLLVIPKKKNGLAPNGPGDDADPNAHPHAGTVAVNGAASNGSAWGRAVGSAALHAAAKDGAPVLSEQELADLKDQL